MLSLYLNKALLFFKMSTYISIYLFHILVHIAFRGLSEEFKGLFCRMKELFAEFRGLVYSYKSLWIKLGRSSIMSFTVPLFRIQLAAYSHNLLFRLFVPLMEINPLFLLISLCMGTSMLLAINSFYYEYSYLSIFAKVHMWFHLAFSSGLQFNRWFLSNILPIIVLPAHYSDSSHQ